MTIENMKIMDRTMLIVPNVPDEAYHLLFIKFEIE